MKLFTALLVTLLLACESSTSFGPCIGISEPEDFNLLYRTSTRNVVLFFETVVVPVVVLSSQTKCPVGKK